MIRGFIFGLRCKCCSDLDNFFFNSASVLCTAALQSQCSRSNTREIWLLQTRHPEPGSEKLHSHCGDILVLTEFFPCSHSAVFISANQNQHVSARFSPCVCRVLHVLHVSVGLSMFCVSVEFSMFSVCLLGSLCSLCAWFFSCSPCISVPVSLPQWQLKEAPGEPTAPSAGRTGSRKWICLDLLADLYTKIKSSHLQLNQVKKCFYMTW